MLSRKQMTSEPFTPAGGRSGRWPTTWVGLERPHTWESGASLARDQRSTDSTGDGTGVRDAARLGRNATLNNDRFRFLPVPFSLTQHVVMFPFARFHFPLSSVLHPARQSPHSSRYPLALTQHVDQAAQQEAVAGQQRAPQPVEEARPAGRARAQRGQGCKLDECVPAQAQWVAPSCAAWCPGALRRARSPCCPPFTVRTGSR